MRCKPVPSRPTRINSGRLTGEIPCQQKKENLMKTMFGALKATLGVALLTTLFASLVNAQCANVGVSKRGVSLLRHQSWTGQFSPALFKLVADGDREASPASDQD